MAHSPERVAPGCAESVPRVASGRASRPRVKPSGVLEKAPVAHWRSQSLSRKGPSGNSGGPSGNTRAASGSGERRLEEPTIFLSGNYRCRLRSTTRPAPRCSLLPALILNIVFSPVCADFASLQTSRADRFCLDRGAGLSPGAGTPSGKRSAGTRRAVRWVCMPSEGTARAAQLAPSAVTASTAGGIGDQKCG